MKKFKPLLDIVLLLGLAGFTLLAIAPEKLVMSSALQMTLLAVVLSTIGGFLVLLWREHPVDEREADNQAIASRIAYIVGACVLIIAMLIESLHHNLDPAVPIALLAMVATKLIIQKYRDK